MLRAMTPLDASVIVPSHRGADRLRTLLPALAAQDHDGPWEVVVVLDGVVDDSPAVLESYAVRAPLRVVTLPEQGGVANALNAGYDAARGRVLIRCDDDLLPPPHMVRRHVELHAGRDDLGVIGPTRDRFDDTPYARAYGRPANARLLRTAYERGPQERWVGWAAHNSLTRATWERVGGFDPAFTYSEDAELGARLHEAGIELVIDRELELAHTAPATSLAERAGRAYVSGSARTVLERTHPRTVTPPPSDHSAWGRAVAGTARLAGSRKRATQLGALGDRALRVLPSGIGGRVAALVVEAAGRAGHRAGADNLAEERWTYDRRPVSETTATGTSTTSAAATTPQHAKGDDHGHDRDGRRDPLDP
ncbi:glycosyl transferase family 2 [Knoellia remsis]|uniref:Glycosyl transferase family 2 n=2 Tax=Knoellia remsis TaxID=407159 RepID=A0A2T0UZA0_9MICO|nr:glycosyl transferase family 2 [Knoellia remsis]